MKKVLKLTLAVVCVMFTSSLFAQKIGYINTDPIVANMAETKDAMAKLEAFAKDLQAQAETLQVELNTKFQEYQKNSATMSDSVKQLKEKELDDIASAGNVSGNGFYYLMGDIARLHSAVLSYARDFMIDRGFTYCIPPYMIRSGVVTGVMSFAEMDAMMYKIEGEDLYLIGTSEHSMIGKFIDTINPEESLPYTLTSYSPCFRKEKGAHGIEERGVYRIHQFEKQEMIVVCRPEESPMWFDKLWQNTVDLFRSLDIPVRTLECCSGDLADLKVKSIDVEAWSPRQQKYFEVGSCSNLGDAQARRLKIRVNSKEKGKYFAHTLNNTVVAPPRMLIAFCENNLCADGSINIPVALRPYMGGKEKIVPKK